MIIVRICVLHCGPEQAPPLFVKTLQIRPRGVLSASIVIAARAVDTQSRQRACSQGRVLESRMVFIPILIAVLCSVGVSVVATIPGPTFITTTTFPTALSRESFSSDEYLLFPKGRYRQFPACTTGRRFSLQALLLLRAYVCMEY